MTPAQQTRFRKALETAFDYPSMGILIADYFAPKAFAAIAPPGQGGFAYSLLLLTEEARMDDWLVDLVAAAHERRPKNAAITQLAEELGLTSTGPRLANPTGQSLESIVRKNAKFINPAQFLEGLSQIEHQVCWIEIGGGGGTGFLVGSDLVMTNDHVIGPIRAGQVAPQNVRVRFDYRKAADGTLLDRKKQAVVELHPAKWLIFRRPPSPIDSGVGGGSPGAEEADCALIRLAEAVGDLPVGGDTVDNAAPMRRWIKIAEPIPAVESGSQVFIMTHPNGDPLQLSIGTVTQFNGAGTRVRYDANSLAGSSGSPVFDADLKLVALHHATDPSGGNQWNQGIPFAFVQKVSQAEQVAIGA